MWQNYFDNNDICYRIVYLKKIAMINDKKLAEFNYKILHNILPCNDNLYKWKKKNTDKCTLCNTKENIPHVLYECIYAKTIWNKVNLSGNSVFSAADVILGTHLGIPDVFITTCISYFIYKKWLRNSFDNVPRNINGVILSLKIELQHVYAIYSHLKCKELCGRLKEAIQLL
ncbi:MAG: hypothetical protein GY702_00005 [Desulfobulbaceae bacterium]|nr:hypothetical protein [Desulfobulbaceae bacterium]